MGEDTFPKENLVVDYWKGNKAGDQKSLYKKYTYFSKIKKGDFRYNKDK